MEVRRALLVGALTAALVAGCGSSSHKSTTGSTSVATSSANTSGITSHLLRNDELAGFTTNSPTTASSAGDWVRQSQASPNGPAAEAARLARLGFVRAASESLTMGSTQGLSLVEQFGTPKEAQTEVNYEAGQFKIQPANSGSKIVTFPVPGIPGARGYAALSSGQGGLNVGFAKGTYVYLVGQVLGPGEPYKSAVIKLIAAAHSLYTRVSP